MERLLEPLVAFNQKPTGPHGFKVWKTVKLGVHKDTSALCEGLTKAGCRIDGGANNMLSNHAFTMSPNKSAPNLVALSVAELGFTNGACAKDIYARAIDLGLRLCPSEVGPQLRLQYTDQAYGELLLIATAPIIDLDGCPSLFLVRHGPQGLWLSSANGYCSGFSRSNYCWVFSNSQRNT